MESMDTSEPLFSRGRGRGARRHADTTQPVGDSPPKVANTSTESVNRVADDGPIVWTKIRSKTLTVNSSRSPPPGSTGSLTQEERIRRAEDRSGVSMDMMNEFFKIGGDMTRFAPQLKTPAFNWGLEPKPEVKDEDEKAEKKYVGRQYATEAQEKELNKVKEFYRQEKESMASNSPVPPSGRQPQTRDSNLSLQTSLSTNIESVGTYRQIEEMEVIIEDESAPELIDRYFSAQRRRVELPISDYEDRIIKAVNACRVVIIEGATGCGKTTQVPQFIADDCAARGVPFNIVVTQPRRIAAKSIAARVAYERDWSLGTIIGYQIGMDSTQVGPETRLLYCTTGVLLQKLINQKNMDHYSHIIIDEVHERSIETDLLMLVIRKLMLTRTHSVKIILMSATFDVSEIRDYFGIPQFNDETGELTTNILPNHIQVDERPQNLAVYYLDKIKRELGFRDIQRDVRSRPDPLEKDAPCVSHEALEVAVHILEKGLKALEEAPGGEGAPTEARGSVLIFLPGLEEIHELKYKLEKSPEKAAQHWLLIPLHSSIPLEKQNLVFQKQRGRERKIILATNIAESSITVPDVSYVIDFCLTKNLVMDVETHIPTLRMEWASKANLVQRAGRAGRCTEGRVYRLINETFFRSSLLSYSQPELNRAPLDLSILRVKMLDMGPPKDLLGLALSPPDLADIYHSVLQLKQVGAFAVMTTHKGRLYYEDEDGDLTTLGRVIGHLPIDIRLGKLLCLGHVFDVLEDCIIIAACLSTQGMFRRDFGQGLDAYKSRLAWSDRSFSDSIAHLNAYKTYKRFSAEFENDQRSAEMWCKQNFIQYKRIREVDYMFGELHQRLIRENIEIPNRPNQRRNRVAEELILKVVMCAAFYPNYFQRNEIEVERIARDLCNKDPLDSVSIQGLPINEGVLYANPLKEMFSICSKRIDISFEDTKAYLTFLDDKHPLKEAFDLHIPDKVKREGSISAASMTSLSTIKSEDRGTPMSDSTLNSSMNTSSAINRLTGRAIKETSIKTAVYVAVAMRQHREVVKELPKIHPTVADREMKAIDKVKEEDQKDRQTMSSHRLSVPDAMTRIPIARNPLPALDCSQIEIRITCIETPTLFYAQYAHKSTEANLQQLSIIISYDLDSVPCDEDCIQKGDVVIAEFVDSNGAKMHGRAVIQNIEYKGVTKEVDFVTIFFIDYGFTRVVENLKEMSYLTGRFPQALLDIPPQAFRCALSEVNPSAITCFDGCWSTKSIKIFKEWVHKRNTMTATIYSVINRVVRLELFENVYRKESFNDVLIHSGCAEKWEESPQSRMNHEQRRRAQLTSRLTSTDELRLEKSEKGVYNPDEVTEVEVRFNPNDNVKTHDKIHIKGPYSPIECTFKGVTHQTATRSTSIDKGSVNCVVLEPDYLSKHTRLLVASSMGLGQNSGNINLRDTTLMPNIRGFPALMALLFAPRVQLRANKERTHYIGAICGLGFDKRTMKSRDQDYDAEIVFDSEISAEDMIKVNVIRFNISTLMKNKESLREFTEGSLAIKQRKIRRNIVELLDRRRRLLDSNKYYPTFKWADNSADDVNSNIDRPESEINAQLLPLCQMPALEPFDYYKDIEMNLKELAKVAKGELKLSTLRCKLCKFTAYTRPDVDNHLKSDQHLDSVRDFNKSYILYEWEVKKAALNRQEEQRIDEGVEEIFDVESDDEFTNI